MMQELSINSYNEGYSAGADIGYEEGYKQGIWDQYAKDQEYVDEVVSHYYELYDNYNLLLEQYNKLVEDVKKYMEGYEKASSQASSIPQNAAVDTEVNYFYQDYPGYDINVVSVKPCYVAYNDDGGIDAQFYIANGYGKLSMMLL